MASLPISYSEGVSPGRNTGCNVGVTVVSSRGRGAAVGARRADGMAMPLMTSVPEVNGSHTRV